YAPGLSSSRKDPCRRALSLFGHQTGGVEGLRALEKPELRGPCPRGAESLPKALGRQAVSQGLLVLNHRRVVAIPFE
ncbi:hypothetical protein MK280_08010, partial [Myxococcota bacterium]|nr:hypothetical protein [Myxococcota bacterium]